MYRFAVVAFLLVASITSTVDAKSPYTRKERRAAQKTMLEVVDEAFKRDEISRSERFRLAMRCRLDAKACCECLEAAAPELAAMEGANPNSFGSDGGGDSGLYKLDIDKLDQLFQLILKYLPQIIEIVQTLFSNDVAVIQAAPGVVADLWFDESHTLRLAV